MFWKAILNGLTQMTHWEIWISAFVYGLVFSLFYLGLGYSIMKSEYKSGSKAAGCLTILIGRPLIQGVLVSFLVTALLPILMGGDDFTPMEFIAEYWWAITKAGVVSILITLLLTIIPLVGDLIAKAPGAAIFVQGAIVFHMLANKALGEILNQSGKVQELFPGFWVTLGFVILSIIIVYAISFTVILILIQLKIINEYSGEKYGLLLGNFFGVIPGILCLCIYCAYISLTIINAVGNTN